MGVLQRFERRFGGLVEGAFAKVFKGEVQPVEIASSLQRETDNQRNVVGEGRVHVPNEFVVELGQHDYDRLNPWAEPLGSELAEMVREHAAESGYTFLGPVTVSLELWPQLSTGAFRVRSTVTPGPLDPPPGSPGPRATQTGSTAAPTGRGLPGHPRLEVSEPGPAGSSGDSRTFPLTHSVTVIGRATEADLRLADPSVSRRHAELRQENGAFHVIDLGSTNGVRVNHTPVSRQELRNGDRVEIGSCVLVFRRDEG